MECCTSSPASPINDDTTTQAPAPKHANQEDAVETKSSEEAVLGSNKKEVVEPKVKSREEEILRELGILHLENTITRHRNSEDETEVDILKQSGIRYVNSAEYEKSISKEQLKEKKKEMNEKMNIKLSRVEVEILRDFGVSWLDNMAVVQDEDTYRHKLDCATSDTAASTVNSTYAERELTRRLKHGWTSTGDQCAECSMPIICKPDSTLLECVICGVVGGEEDNFKSIEEKEEDDDGEPKEYNPDHLIEEMESPGVINLGTNMSTITPSIVTNDRFGIEEHDHEDTAEEETKKKAEQDEAAYNEALGRRLFDGWELTKLNCPDCNSPLLSEYPGATSVCLRCG